MDAVILFSHGSVLCGSGGALLSHAARFRSRNGHEQIVEVGYLNYSDPPFTTAVERCAAAGAARIFVVPYFLVPGKFVTIDLPAAIGVARRQYPGIQFVVAEAIGYDEMLADAILESAAKALPQSRWREDLKAASSHCLANPMCPLYGTQDCPKHPVRNTEGLPLRLPRYEVRGRRFPLPANAPYWLLRTAARVL